MERLRFNRLGIEIEINTGEPNLFEINNLFEIKETKTCVKVSCEGKKVATILPDSKIEIGGLVHITCYKGRVVVFGDAYIEAGGMSKIFAKDKAQVVAYQGAEVRAGGRTKVRALDNSRVVAGGRAEVFLDGKSLGYKWPRSRAKMKKLNDQVTVFNLN
jgi:hypothetical protein